MQFITTIPASQKENLAKIWHWNNLKIGFDHDAKKIWLKDFTTTQIESVVLKSMPYATVYEVKNGDLFPKGRLLPTGKLPNVLWTPIQRALPIELPSFNHNYFGDFAATDKVRFELVHQSEAQTPIACLYPIDQLATYVETAPQIRLQTLEWVLLQEKTLALVFGTPLLPIPSEQTFWQNGDFLLPLGYQLNWHLLTQSLNQQINPNKQNIVIWQQDNSYFLVEKFLFRPLSLGSFRRSFSNA